MTIRGSARFLLPLIRSHAKLVLGIGVAASVLVLGGMAQSGAGFKLMEQTGLGQLVHQRAWERVLASHAEQEPWPWEDPSPMASTNVPQLGMSAAVLESLSDQRRSSEAEPPQSRVELSKEGEFGAVAIGDRITVTKSDGSSSIYKVTGRRVVDPHLAESGPAGEEGDASLVACSPLDAFVAGSLRVIIQATEPELPEPAPAESHEQKL